MRPAENYQDDIRSWDNSPGSPFYVDTAVCFECEEELNNKNFDYDDLFTEIELNICTDCTKNKEEN